MKSRETADRSLQQKIDEHGSALKMLRNAQAGPYVFPIPAEYSNWREEQRAWRETVALMDMSFHMSDLYIEGPDAKKFIASLAVNSFDNFGGNKAKQFVACAPSGYLIGDMICIGLSELDSQESGGERGIRTLEGLLTLTPLAGARLRPLGHLSVRRAGRHEGKTLSTPAKSKGANDTGSAMKR